MAIGGQIGRERGALLHFLLWVLVGWELLGLWGCQSSTPTTPSYRLSWVECQRNWKWGEETYRRIAVKWEGSTPASPESLIAYIFNPSDTTSFSLWDDGSSRILPSESFSQPQSGDLWHSDQIYTRTINALFATSPGTYTLAISLPSEPILPRLSTFLIVRTNSFPVVLHWSSPDSLFSGLGGAISATISDSDGQGDIARVEWVVLKARPLRDLWALRPLFDTLWSADITPAIGVGTPTGLYHSFLRVADLWMLGKGLWATSDTQIVWVENLPPQITSVTGPETLWVGENDTIRFQYLIKVEDPQTSEDLDSLLLTIRDTSRVVGNFFYFDDGTGLDSLPRDGLFHSGFTVDPSSRTGVPFTFRWQPTDRSPQRGEVYYSTLIILRPPRTFPSPETLPGEPLLSKPNDNLSFFPKIW